MSTTSGLYGVNLVGLFGGGASTPSLLDVLYGNAGGTVSSIPAVTALRNAEQDETKQVAITAQQPAVKRAIADFKAGVAKATSVDALLSNPAVMQVLLRANGLGDQAAYKALAKRALTSDTTDPRSLANTLSDTRWKSVAKTYDFANKGLAVIQDPKVIQAVADGYAEITWRESLDKATPGLSNALTFRAQAAQIGSVYDILGNKVLREVVTKALGVPAEIAFQPLDAQAKAITTRLDLTRFRDPKFVESFTQRYLIAASGIGATSGTTAAGGTAATLTSLAAQARGLIV